MGLLPEDSYYNIFFILVHHYHLLLGGPDGEMGASMRYLSQRYAMPYREVMGVMTDIGTDVSKQTLWKYALYFDPFDKSLLIL